MLSRNPTFKENNLNNYYNVSDQSEMTISGVVNRSIFLWIILLCTGGYAWKLFSVNPSISSTLLTVSLIGAFILAMIISFKPNSAPLLSPFYAALEGFLLGSISFMFEMKFPGIVTNAIILTTGIFGTLLFGYKSGIIRLSQKMQAFIVMATGGIFLLYSANLLLGFFGINIPFIYSSSPFGIGFTIAVVIIASLSLIMDMQYIDNASKRGLPKYFEWYFSFSLMVTLVWLYMEILKLLSLISRRD